jgi:FliI/YscN family ATPase
MKPVIQRWYNILETFNDTVVVDAENVFIGELCVIKISGDKSVYGEVTSFRNSTVNVTLLGEGHGISNNSLVSFTGKAHTIRVTADILGSVVNADFNILDRLSIERDDSIVGAAHEMDIFNHTVSPLNRAPVNEICYTGIKSIDSFLTVGIGQRIGIFAPAGCGKTTLMISLLQGIKADVYIVVLIGERGREVNDFITHHIPEEFRKKTIVVYSTSDQSSILRRNAALIGTSIAEYFRELGLHVLFLFDSITRYSRALREIALDNGEVANDKFPASVYSNIPKIMERTGKTKQGAITAFYTVLLEGEANDDVLGNEIKSILDGHFYLSNKLASKNHYPAIDVLSSKSRLYEELVDTDHREKIATLRGALDKYKELEFVLDIGEYKEGANPANDKVIGNIEYLNQFLKQNAAATFSSEEIDELLNALYQKFN